MKYVEVLMQGLRKFLKHLYQQLSLGASSAYRIIQEDVKLSIQNPNAASPSWG
jgi:hypothetical protein